MLEASLASLGPVLLLLTLCMGSFVRLCVEVGSGPSALQPAFPEKGSSRPCVLALAHERLTHRPTPACPAWGPEALGLGARAGQWLHSGCQPQALIVPVDTACLRAVILALTPQGA